MAETTIGFEPPVIVLDGAIEQPADGHRVVSRGRRLRAARARARDVPARRHGSADPVEPARPRRRVLPDGPQGELHPDAGQGREADLPHGQRRRVRARDVQGSRDHAARPAPADRGLPHRRARDLVEARVHLHPRRVLAGVRGARGRARRSARRRAARRRRADDPPRRRRVHLRRGDGAPGVARGQARPAAVEAAVPGDPGSLRVADADQQRRDDHERAEGARARAAGVLADRRAAGLDRHARVLSLRQRREARRVRGAARHHGAPSDRGHRRRHPERAQAEGRHGRRLVVPRHDAGRARHEARRRLARPEGALHRLRRDHGDRRPGVHRPVRASRRAVLHARVVRQVHAVPRRHALARADPARRRGRNRDGERPRGPARRLRPHHRQVPVRARRLGRDAGRELRDEVPRRVPGAPRVTAAARSARTRRWRTSSPRRPARAYAVPHEVTP